MNEVLHKKLEELQNKQFMINMIDHWSYKDSERYSELSREIADIRRQLKEQGEEV